MQLVLAPARAVRWEPCVRADQASLVRLAVVEVRGVVGPLGRELVQATLLRVKLLRLRRLDGLRATEAARVARRGLAGHAADHIRHGLRASERLERLLILRALGLDLFDPGRLGVMGLEVLLRLLVGKPHVLRDPVRVYTPGSVSKELAKP